MANLTRLWNHHEAEPKHNPMCLTTKGDAPNMTRPVNTPLPHAHLALHALLAAALLHTTGCLTTFDADGVEVQANQDNDPNNDTNNDLPDMGMDVEDDADMEDEEPPMPDCVDDQPCEPFAGTLGVCNQGACIPTGCDTGFLDCNGNLQDDGCEEDSNTSITACGACSNPCEGGNAQWTCVERTCQIDTCDDTFIDFDEDPQNGCEARQPPPATVAEVTAANHGLRVRWDNPPGNFTPANVEVTWVQRDQPAQTRRVRPIGNQAIVGPVIDEGILSVSVRFINDQGILGPQTDAFDISDYRPAGWFDRSNTLFYVDGVATSADEILLVGMGFTRMGLESGDILVPGKIPSIFGTVAFDMVKEGPLAGFGITAGFLGEVFVTFDHGMTWVRRNIPLEGNNGGLLQSAVILPNGRIVVAGEGSLLKISDDQGQNWTDAPIATDREDWGGLSYISQDNENGVLVVGGTTRGDNANEYFTVVAISEDNGDTWFVRNLEPENDNTPVEPIFASHMVSPTQGFIGGESGFYMTENGWETSVRVNLPNEPTDEDLGVIRLVFDQDGTNGLITANSGRNWSTDDGGANWTFLDDIPSAISEEAIVAVVPLPGQRDPSQALLGSNLGQLQRWDKFSTPEGVENDFEVLQEGGRFIDLVGVSSVENLSSVRVVTRDGVVLRGQNNPESLRPFRTLSYGQGEFSNAQVNAMVASGDRQVLVAVGNNRYAQYSRDQGDTWFNFTNNQRANEHFNKVALNSDGSHGIAVGGTDDNTVYHLAVETNRLITIEHFTVDPDQALQGDRITAVAMSDEGTSVAVAVFQTARTRILRGDGPPGQWEWTSIDLPTGTPAIESMVLSADGEQLSACGGRGRVFSIAREEPILIPVPLLPGYDRIDEMKFNLMHFDEELERGYLFTERGWVLRTENGGGEWIADKPLAAFRDADGTNFNGITLSEDGQRALVVGDFGKILWTANGGIPIPPILP